MIYEERTTLVEPSTENRYIEYCRREFWPKLEHLGAEVVCLLNGLIGDPPNSILQMVRYPDIDTWQNTQPQIESPPAGLVRREQSRLFRAVSSRPKAAIPTDDRRT